MNLKCLLKYMLLIISYFYIVVLVSMIFEFTYFENLYSEFSLIIVMISGFISSKIECKKKKDGAGDNDN